MPKDTAQKVAENRLRRVAARRGLRVRKSPRRDPLAADYGLWDVAYIDDAPSDGAYGDEWALFAGLKFEVLAAWVEEYDGKP